MNILVKSLNQLNKLPFVLIILFCLILILSQINSNSLYDNYDDVDDGINNNGKFSRKCIDGDFVSDPSDSIVTLNVAVYQWQFSYCSITVYQNQHVILNLKSLDVPHGLYIEGMPDLKIFITPDTISTLKFDVSQKGEFPYFCTVFCGEGHPIHKGLLIVK